MNPKNTINVAIDDSSGILGKSTVADGTGRSLKNVKIVVTLKNLSNFGDH